MNEAPRVSVIIPVWNRRELLAECLGGLAAQTYRDFEVIVIDDRSTDGSPEVVEKAAAAGLPATLLQNPGKGAVPARCAGIAMSAGELLAFTDSDCVPEPGWLAAAVDAIDAGADLVQGMTLAAREFEPHEHTIGVRQLDPRFPTCNMVYRRTAYDDVGGFEPEGVDRLGFRPGGALAGLDFGIDTSLAWRAQRRGWRAVFAPAAVVRHAVFPFDRAEALRRAWLSGAFPMLVQEVPEVAGLLRWGVLFGGIEQLPLYAAGVALVLGRPRVAAAGAAAWAALSYRSLLKGGLDPGRALRRLPDSMSIRAVSTAAMVVGSIRARRLVL